MTRLIGKSLLLIAIAAVSHTAGFCAGRSTAESDIPREVLVLYDSRVESAPALTLAHQFLEFPLNWAGLAVRYHDLSRGLPKSVEEDRKVRGVLSCFPRGMSVDDADAYLVWAAALIKSGKKFVIIGEPGFAADKTGKAVNVSRIEALMSKLGLKPSGKNLLHTVLFKEKQHDGNIVFEGAAPASYMPVWGLRAEGKDVHVLLSAEAAEGASVLAAVNGNGGYAASGFAFIQESAGDGASEVRYWHINPFSFLESALGVHGLPRADVTMLNGRRVVYGLVEGIGISERIEGAKGPETLRDVFQNEIAKPYASFPFTVSPFTATRNVDLIGNRAEEDLASLSELVIKELNSSPRQEGRSGCWIWPQDETLSSEALQTVAKATACQAVAGRSRLDAAYPSVAWLQPLSYQTKGGERVAYSALAGEQSFSDKAAGAEYAYKAMIETIKRTDGLKAAGLDFEFAALRSRGRLNSILFLLDYIQSHKFTAVPFGQYVDSVNGFNTVEFQQCGTGCFRVKGRGALQTIRFDHASGLKLSPERCEGVLGSSRRGDSLYVSLDPQSETSVVALTGESS